MYYLVTHRLPVYPLQLFLQMITESVYIKSKVNNFVLEGNGKNKRHRRNEKERMCTSKGTTFVSRV